jgi:hypothetical protein
VILKGPSHIDLNLELKNHFSFLKNQSFTFLEHLERVLLMAR